MAFKTAINDINQALKGKIYIEIGIKKKLIKL